jgi:hypothetical protein
MPKTLLLGHQHDRELSYYLVELLEMMQKLVTMVHQQQGMFVGFDNH